MSGKSQSIGSVEVRAEHVSRNFGEFQALDDVSLTVPAGKFVSLLGSSGSGKTTLLRIISGLLDPDAGRIFIGNRDVTGIDANKRNIGFVFQNYALFPHLSVFDNVAFGLRLRGVAKNDVQRRVDEALERVYLSGLGRRKPAELSGGQQQRVALARAMVFSPAVMLMDEPLGSLDKRLRQQLQIELRKLQHEIAITTIYVTHDQDEAFGLSDQIAVMSGGRIQQLASPEDIYRRPANSFVANFVGDLNLLEGKVVAVQGNDIVAAGEAGLKFVVPNVHGKGVGERVTCGVRPERMLVELPGALKDGLAAVVRTLTFHGTHFWLELALPAGRTLIAMRADIDGITEGSNVSVGWEPKDVIVFA